MSEDIKKEVKDQDTPNDEPKHDHEKPECSCDKEDKKENGKHEHGGKHEHHKMIEELKLQIEEKDGEIASLKNDYARAYADTENTRKRLTTEFESNMKYRIQDFAMDILPVIDNCERALQHETTDENYRTGVEMIYAQLLNALKKEGVEEIDCLNKPFDPNFQQAIMTEKVDGVESGVVVEVLQKGYKLKDRILRAAMVKVSE